MMFNCLRIAELSAKLISSLTVTVFTLSCLPLAAFAQTLDLEPPEIQHEVVTTGFADEAQNFEAIVTDNVALESVSLFYRFGDSGEFERLAMQLTSGDSFSASVNMPSTEDALIQYYIEAVDTNGSAINRGFTFNPFEREIKSRNASEPAPISNPVTKSSNKTLWYVLGGVLLAGIIAGAASGGGGGSGTNNSECANGNCTVTLQLGQP